MTSKGQVTIPKDVREALGLTPGTKITFTPGAKGEYILSTAMRPLAALAGSLRHDSAPLSLEDMDEAIALAVNESA